MVEIGSWAGRSSVCAAAACSVKKAHLICIDTWAGTVGWWDKGYDRVKTEDIFAEWTENVKRFFPAVFPQRGDSRQAHTTILNFSCDLIFIDGDHSFEAVTADILNYEKKLRPGGLLCGHDISLASVRKAVTKLYEYAIVGDSTIWLGLQRRGR